MCATSQRITNILHYFFYYRILKTRLSIFPRNQKKKDRNFCLVFFLLPIPILVVASYRSWDFDRVYEFFSLLHRWCEKKEDLFHLLYDYTYLAGRDHFETSPLCDKDGTHRLNPYHTQESFLTSLCTTFYLTFLLSMPYHF